MDDREEALRLANAAVRRLHDLDNVLRAVSTATQLVGNQLHDIEEALVAIGGYIRAAPDEKEEGQP